MVAGAGAGGVRLFLWVHLVVGARRRRVGGWLSPCRRAVVVLHAKGG